jgi:hypothetical protein
VKVFGRTVGCGTCLPAVDTPVGETCLRCGVAIKADDVGVVMPYVAETVVERPWHLTCFREALGIGEAS